MKVQVVVLLEELLCSHLSVIGHLLLPFHGVALHNLLMSLFQAYAAWTEHLVIAHVAELADQLS